MINQRRSFRSASWWRRRLRRLRITREAEVITRAEQRAAEEVQAEYERGSNEDALMRVCARVSSPARTAARSARRPARSIGARVAF